MSHGAGYDSSLNFFSMISFNSFVFTVWPLSSALNLVHLFLRGDVFVSDNEISVLLPCTIALGLHF